jgi:hypothetical protein
MPKYIFSINYFIAEVCSISPVLAISLGGTINPGEPVGGNSRQ